MHSLHDSRGFVPRSFVLHALAFTALLLTGPLQGSAQDRELVFNQVTVSSQEAGIELEFADGTTLSALFRDGRVSVNGQEVGQYSPGGPLEASWRRLLGDAVSSDNGAVVGLLREWSPPGDLDDEAARAAGALTAELSRLTTYEPEDVEPALQAIEGEDQLLRRLVLDPEYLRSLTAAVADGRVRPDHIAIQEEFRIGAGETLDGSLLALDSRVEVDGTLAGDLVLLGGRLRLGEDGRITGDLRWSGSDLPDDRTGIAGQVREIEPVVGLSDSELRDRIRSEVSAATADVRRQATRTTRTTRMPFGGMFRGIAGLFQAAVTFLILLVVGLGILHFFPRQLDVVSRTAMNAPGRSFMVGVAGAVLSFPVWIAGIVLLTVTVIGIPALIVWLPAFPMVIAGLIIFGYVAVSRNVGHWVSHRDFQGLEGMDTTRPAMQIGLGLVALLGLFAVASVLRMGGMIFAPFHVLMTVVGFLLTIGAGSIGLGAVLLSRAGRDTSFAGTPWADPDLDPWAPAPDPFDPGPEPARARADDPNAAAPGEPGTPGPDGPGESYP